MRSKRFRAVSDPGVKKDRGTTRNIGSAARKMEREPKKRMLPALVLIPFFPRSLTLVPRCLLRNCTETLATQTNKSQTVQFEEGRLAVESLPLTSINEICG